LINKNNTKQTYERLKRQGALPPSLGEK